MNERYGSRQGSERICCNNKKVHGKDSDKNKILGYSLNESFVA